jgi:hypothetical protein
MPANGVLLRISPRSLDAEFGQSRSEIADSLRRILEIFPFSGDRDRRRGSICTAWPSLQCHSPNSPPWPPANWEFIPASLAGSRSLSSAHPSRLRRKSCTRSSCNDTECPARKVSGFRVCWRPSATAATVFRWLRSARSSTGRTRRSGNWKLRSTASRAVKGRHYSRRQRAHILGLTYAKPEPEPSRATRQKQR